jgi:signal transduction histidine kinase
MITSTGRALPIPAHLWFALLTVVLPLAFVQAAGVVVQVRGYTGLVLDTGGLVVEVADGSPASAVGLAPGDRLSLAGAPLTPAQLGWLNAGERLRIAAQRAAITREVELVAAQLPPREWAVALWPLLSGFVYWVVAARLLVGMRQPSSNVLRFAGFAFLAAAQAIATRLLDPVYPLNGALVLLLWIGTALSFVYFHAFFPFPMQRTWFGSAMVWHRRAGLGLLLLVAAGAIWALLTNRALTPVFNVAALLYDVAAQLLVVVALAYAYLRSGSQRIRSVVRLIGAATGLVYLLELLLLASVLFADSGPGGTTQVLLARTSLFAQALVPLAYLAALRLEDFAVVDRALNRTFVYSLVVLLLLGLHWLTVLVLMQLLGGWAGSSLLLHSLIGAALAVLFAPLRDRVALLVDRVFYGREATVFATVERLAGELARSRDEQTLVQLLVQRLVRLFDVSDAALFLQNAERGWYRRAMVGRELPAAMIEGVAALSAQLARRSVVRAAAVRRLAPSVALDPSVLPREGMFVCFAADDRPRGVLWLGVRANGDGYTPRDAQLLKLLALPGALALENVDLNRSLAERNQELQYLYNELSLAEERVRQQLSHELHDNIMQDLYGELYVLQAGQNTGTIDTATLEQMQHRIEKVLADLRRICNGLRPPVMEELGLPAALRILVAESTQATAAQCLLDGQIDDLPTRPPPDVESALFAIAKSALTNALRHSEASTISLSLRMCNDVLTLDICDDGVGFELPANWSTLLIARRFGLVSMRERAQMIGADFSATSAPAKGTQISVRWPGSVVLTTST